MYQQVKHSEILLSAHTLYLRVLYESQIKQLLFPFTALTFWFLKRKRSIYCAVRTGYLNKTGVISSFKV